MPAKRVGFRVERKCKCKEKQVEVAPEREIASFEDVLELAKKIEKDMEDADFARREEELKTELNRLRRVLNRTLESYDALIAHSAIISIGIKSLADSQSKGEKILVKSGREFMFVNFLIEKLMAVTEEHHRAIMVELSELPKE